MNPCLIAIEPPSAHELSALTEKLQQRSADRASQLARMNSLIENFEKQALTLTASAYMLAQAEIQQQGLIVQAALDAQAAAEAAHAAAQFEAEQRSAERARLQRLETIDAALQAKTAEITDLHRQLGALPEKLARLRHEHSTLLAERTRI